MPVNKKFKNSSAASASRKSAKAYGTRVGILEDWRAASGKSGKTPTPHRNAFRDGR